MKNKWSFILILMMVFTLAAGSSAFAFADIQGDPGQASIQALKDQGLISGVDGERFDPSAAMSYSQAVHVLVKSFGLNLDRFRFIKEPLASDYYTAVSNDAWYAQDFIVAQLNGLPVPKDVKPDAPVTREQYAELLCKAMLTKGDFAFIDVFVLIGDESEVDESCMSSVQTLLIAKIAKLEQDQKFLPKKAVTRSEAAIWLYQALLFVNAHPTGEPGQHDKITVTIEQVNADVSRVILSRGQKPNPGYSIRINSIEFMDKTALIHYRLSDPDPDKMYPAVMVEAEDSVYIPSGLQVKTTQDK